MNGGIVAGRLGWRGCLLNLGYGGGGGAELGLEPTISRDACISDQAQACETQQANESQSKEFYLHLISLLASINLL